MDDQFYFERADGFFLLVTEDLKTNRPQFSTFSLQTCAPISSGPTQMFHPLADYHVAGFSCLQTAPAVLSCTFIHSAASTIRSHFSISQTGLQYTHHEEYLRFQDYSATSLRSTAQYLLLKAVSLSSGRQRVLLYRLLDSGQNSTGNSVWYSLEVDLAGADAFHTDLFEEGGQPYLLLGKVPQEELRTARVDVSYFAVQEAALTIIAAEPSLENVFLQVDNEGAIAEVSVLALYPARAEDPHGYLKTILLLLLAALVLLLGLAGFLWWKKRRGGPKPSDTHLVELDDEREDITPAASKKIK